MTLNVLSAVVVQFAAMTAGMVFLLKATLLLVLSNAQGPITKERTCGAIQSGQRQIADSERVWLPAQAAIAIAIVSFTRTGTAGNS
jgi:hypothetical protein